jgi:hypothetical protein
MAHTTSTVLVIKRPEGIYKYNTTQNKYMLITGVVPLQPSSSQMTKDPLNNQTITTLGTEIIDGKTATVIQFTPSQAGNSTIMKMWIWNEKGVSLKALFATTSGKTTIKMDMKYSNYSFRYFRQYVQRVIIKNYIIRFPTYNNALLV